MLRLVFRLDIFSCPVLGRTCSLIIGKNQVLRVQCPGSIGHINRCAITCFVPQLQEVSWSLKYSSFKILSLDLPTPTLIRFNVFQTYHCNSCPRNKYSAGSTHPQISFDSVLSIHATSILLWEESFSKTPDILKKTLSRF